MAAVTTEDVIIDPVTMYPTARLYLPANSPIKPGELLFLVYFHGGAFKHGSTTEPAWDNHLKSIVSQAGLLAVSVDYRLAPWHRLPSAHDEAWTALTWVVSPKHPWEAQHGDLDRLFVAGDSAGANITHQVALRAGACNDVKVKGVALVHPYFCGEEPLPSETRDPAVRWGVRKDWQLAMPKTSDWNLDHPWINPVAASAPSFGRLGCERAMVCVASEDILQWRGRAYHDEELIKEHVQVELVGSSRGMHCFHLVDPVCIEAVKLRNKLVDFFTSALRSFFDTRNVKVMDNNNLRGVMMKNIHQNF